MYAHYFKSGKTHRLVVSKSVRPMSVTGEAILFENKKQVNAYMKANPTLIAWNF